SLSLGPLSLSLTFFVHFTHLLTSLSHCFPYIPLRLEDRPDSRERPFDPEQSITCYQDGGDPPRLAGRRTSLAGASATDCCPSKSTLSRRWWSLTCSIKTDAQ